MRIPSASRDADRGKTMEKMFSVVGSAAEFRKRFEVEKEIINCRELAEADLTTSVGIEQGNRGHL